MSGVTSLGIIAKRLGYQLHQTDVATMALLSAELAEHGLTPARATALFYVALHEGCDQVALGRALGVNRASTMKLVDQLVALGAVERRPGRDRRSNALHMTPAGLVLQEKVEQATALHDQHAFGDLSADERAELRRLLSKVRTSVRSKPKA
ncbi:MULTISPECIES: MarR family winged helix-turn-helix transcriptional regulator [Kordiimonadales]|uniref:MarR family winged helix-turn-helix transcriptional regulator n=1 Tax=Gimibacter soli TaxID=3024400 RepID=A0AAE9XM42_9PROT|nr:MULTISPECIES: MarR family winged helix-turn-helix transcriptional regulator [Kordiimonadales]WCL53434.1 MarR family winged helix-turn-helix transcriptional regulator [Gimibacter soli]